MSDNINFIVKKIALILIIFISAFSASARSWIETGPETVTYNAKACALVKNPAAPCNQGKESFSSFLKRFTASKAFRNNRIKATSISFPATKSEIKEQLGYIETVEFPTGRKKGELGTFYNVKADMVCYRFDEYPEELDPECEWGGSSLGYCFQRVAGLWYLTGILLAG